MLWAALALYCLIALCLTTGHALCAGMHSLSQPADLLPAANAASQLLVTSYIGRAVHACTALPGMHVRVGG